MEREESELRHQSDERELIVISPMRERLQKRPFALTLFLRPAFELLAFFSFKLLAYLPF